MKHMDDSSAQQRDQAIANYNRALEHYKNGQLEHAYNDLTHTLTLFTTTGEEKLVAQCEYFLGGVTRKLRLFEQARTHCHNALEIFIRLGLEQKASDCERTLGNVAQELGKFEQAKAHYQQAQQGYTRLGLGDC